MSFEKLNELKRELSFELFQKFINADSNKRTEILKEYNIKYKGEYLGVYNSSSNMVEFKYLMNPFNGERLSANLRDKLTMNDSQCIKVILSANRMDERLTPENVFVCWPVVKKDKSGAIPIYTKQEIEKEQRKMKEDMEARNTKLRENHSYSKDYRKEQLEPIITSRNIGNLVHFTNIKNLKSILEHGILPIRTMLLNDIGFYRNDRERYDYGSDCVCVSVTEPNYYLIDEYKKRFPREKMIEIFLSPELLYEQENYYAYHNAATLTIGANIRFFNDISYFKKMFAKELKVKFADGRILRISREPYLKENQTTSVQAEILVRGKIDCKHIKAIKFPDVKA